MTVTDARRTDTRERILIAASHLFAVTGYHATTTRDIADAVGIRQPSLFHHFPSKAAIMEALLSYDLDAYAFVEAVAEQPVPAADRLYRYVRQDAELVTGSPYNLSGLYTDAVNADPDFASLIQRGERTFQAIRRIVRDGVAAGEFVAIDDLVAGEAIYGILHRAWSMYSGGKAKPPDDLGDQLGSFALRGLLTDPGRLPEIRARFTDEG